jgi:hypothetical protein
VDLVMTKIVVVLVVAVEEAVEVAIIEIEMVEDVETTVMVDMIINIRHKTMVVIWVGT